MSTLRAGSYLKLLSRPEMDLMDIVNEEAPEIRSKVRQSGQVYPITLYRGDPLSGEELDVREYVLPYHRVKDRIDYECTKGLRFSNCSQRTTVFDSFPLFSPEPPVTGCFARMASPHPEDWSWHGLLKGPAHYGLLCWADGVDNELFPGYPGEAQHLVDFNDDALDIDEELVRAYDTIRPAITSDMSLLVTLAELKDVKSLFSEPLSFTDKFVRLVGRKRAANMTFAQILADQDMLSFVAKSLAKGHLYTEFGLKQTKRDLTSLFSTFYSLDRTVREILSMTGENTRHYSIPVKTVEEERSEDLFQDFNWIIARRWKSVFTRKFVVTMKYTTELVDAYGQSISPYDPELVKLGAAMDKLGLNMNPAILWDLVPFSFVVDYFVGIGDWLERFKRSNLNLTFLVKDSCYSVKRTCATEGTTQRWSATWDGMDRYPDHPLAAREDYLGGLRFRLDTREYDRVRFVPTLRMLSGLEAPDWRLPNLSQLKIMSSLLTANLPIFGK